jgi:hypothetical protein
VSNSAGSHGEPNPVCVCIVFRRLEPANVGLRLTLPIQRACTMATEKERRERDERTKADAAAVAEAERDARNEKTARLREARLAAETEKQIIPPNSDADLDDR